MKLALVLAALLLSACGGGDYTEDEDMHAPTKPTMEAAR